MYDVTINSHYIVFIYDTLLFKHKIIISNGVIHVLEYICFYDQCFLRL